MRGASGWVLAAVTWTREVDGQFSLLIRDHSGAQRRWSKPIERGRWVALIVGILGAVLIAVGMFFLLVGHQQ